MYVSVINWLILLGVYFLGAKYGFGLSADFLRKPVIHALRGKSEVRTDNPWIVRSIVRTFAPRNLRFAQTILGWYLVLDRPSLRQSLG